MPVGGTATRPEGRSERCRSLADTPRPGLGRDQDCLCWFQRDLPVRLQPSDLGDPMGFHRRLSDWLMQQR